LSGKGGKGRKEKRTGGQETWGRKREGVAASFSFAGRFSDAGRPMRPWPSRGLAMGHAPPPLASKEACVG